MAGESAIQDNYEFLDHTADVQIHAWGRDLKEAFEKAAIAMTAYITDISKIDIHTKVTISVEAEDLSELLYRFLDEVLFLFNAEPFLLSKLVEITSMNYSDEDGYMIEADCHGEAFSLGKHCQGTEIKAITYSAMKIRDESDCHEVFFIVDI